MVEYSRGISGYGTAPASAATGLINVDDLLASGSLAGTPGINDLGGAIDIGSGVTAPGGIAGQIGGFGLNMDTAKLGLTGLATLGNLYGALQANKLAKKQFEFTRKMGNANLANSIQSYNTTLADRLNSRATVEGTSADEAAAAIAANRLKDVKL